MSVCSCQGKTKSISSKFLMSGVPTPVMQVSKIERGDTADKNKEAPVTGSQPLALDNSVESEPLGLGEYQDKGNYSRNETGGPCATWRGS